MPRKLVEYLIGECLDWWWWWSLFPISTVSCPTTTAIWSFDVVECGSHNQNIPLLLLGIYCRMLRNSFQPPLRYNNIEYAPACMHSAGRQAVKSFRGSAASIQPSDSLQFRWRGLIITFRSQIEWSNWQNDVELLTNSGARVLRVLSK